MNEDNFADLTIAPFEMSIVSTPIRATAPRTGSPKLPHPLFCCEVDYLTLLEGEKFITDESGVFVYVYREKRETDYPLRQDLKVWIQPRSREHITLHDYDS